MVFVVDKRKRPLMPCSEKRARLLLQRGRAVVHRIRPFIIRLKDRIAQTSTMQPVALKIDPGAQTTGVALVREEQTATGAAHHTLHLAELQHRGLLVHALLLRRAQARRSRRARKTRYRPPRCKNRCRPKGWLPPSLRSRLNNVLLWATRYRRWTPVGRADVEWVRFDTQWLQNPHITGVEYQQGTLYGYELREWLLEKWDRRCAYCKASQVPLQIEHIVPRSRHGTDRVSNLTLACVPCNTAKGTMTATEFGYPEVQAEAMKPLRDAAAVNITRFAICHGLRAHGFAVMHWTGGRTKWNRTRVGLPKTHALDALCVGDIAAVTGAGMLVLGIQARGRGMRCRTSWTTQGFPRGYKIRHKSVQGFQTGDLVRADVPAGKHAGTRVGRVAVRASGSFRVGDSDGINWRYCTLMQRADGYDYMQTGAWHFLPAEKGGRGCVARIW
jgi:5-methylcytosine-specific restriction endonuclease McrA